jgi:5-methylcytosine-specific restriction endonuclease McrA
MKVISWQKAVCLWLDNKAEIIETYASRVYDAIRDWSGNMPAVIRLKKYVHVDRQKIKFSRINVFGRDFFTCMYCSAQPGTSNLTYDHVIPRSRGGKTCWENIATSCIDCNSKKADRTPQEAGMPLKVQPVKPKIRPQFKFALTSPTTPSEWRSYLYWNTELDEG